MKNLILSLAAVSLFFAACTQAPSASDVEQSKSPEAKSTSMKSDEDIQKGYDIGSVVGDFVLKNANKAEGQADEVRLADHADAKGFIVIFTCNHCPYSVAYEDRIVALDKEYAAKGYPVIAINPNDPIQYPTDDFDAMTVRAKEKGFTFPYIFDETQEVAKTYGATRTPHVFILEKTDKGNVVRFIGAIDNSTYEPEEADEKYIEAAVNSLLNGDNVEIEKVKAIGCSIKWKA